MAPVLAIEAEGVQKTYARVRPGQGTFSVDMALPIEVLKDAGPCRRDRREAR
jgi:hypothetical protein